MRLAWTFTALTRSRLAPRAYGVDLLVGDALPGFMLVGMSFIERFQTTLDLDSERVLFRARNR